MTNKRLLVPVDFSAQQEAVIAQASALAGRLDAEIVLLHCAPSPSISVVAVEPIYVPAEVMERFTRDIGAQVTKKMDELAESIRAEGLQVEVMIKTSAIDETIVAVAKDLAAAAIIMGSHGAGLDRFLLGSIAESVSRRAPCPVVVARGEDEGSAFKNVLLGIDFSDFSRPLVEMARHFAPKDGQIHLVHCWQPPHLDSAHLFGSTWYDGLFNEMSDGLAEHTKALEAFANSLPEDDRYVLHLESGRPSTCLLQLEESLKADAIFVGAHDSESPADILGTVADRVLRHAKTTVLLTDPTTPL